MFADFLPPDTVEIQDSDAIVLLQQIQRRIVQVSCQAATHLLPDRSVEIATAYVHSVPDRVTSDQLKSSFSNPPILLLHGFDSSLLEFRRLIPLLANRHKIWAIDLFGAGFTAYIPTLAVTPQTIRQHLLSVITTWIDQPVILVGASLGGAVAIDFALHYPNWVRSLVLIDSVGFSGSFPVGQFLPQPLIELGADWLYFRKQVALAAASVLPAMNPALIDALRCALLHQQMPGWKAAITSFTQSGGYANLSDRIAAIQHPTLILWGTDDDVLGTTDATRFKQAIPGSQLVWIQQAGHVPHFDQPQSVADLLLAFA